MNRLILYLLFLLTRGHGQRRVNDQYTANNPVFSLHNYYYFSYLALQVLSLLFIGLGIIIQVKNTAAQNQGNYATEQFNDNDDIFVPYQGERYSVFDWNFCKV